MPNFASTVTLYDNLFTVFGVLKTVLRPQCLDVSPRFRVVRVEGLPHPTNLPPEGNPPPPHPTQVGSFLFFGDFSAFLNLCASRKSDFLFPANIFGGNPARSWPLISPVGYGIAARSTPKQRKTSAFRCVFHTKRAIFDRSMPGMRFIHEKFSCIHEKM